MGECLGRCPGGEQGNSPKKEDLSDVSVYGEKKKRKALQRRKGSGSGANQE